MSETMTKKAPREVREGLMLCMLLTAFIAPEYMDDQLAEISRITLNEPEFGGEQPGDIDALLETVQKDLHKDPDQLLKSIGRKLGAWENRRRGLELAVRVVTCNGIVTEGQRIFLEQMVKHLDLTDQALETYVITAQKRLVRFMITYLVYLTAAADEILSPSEFEEMIPFALGLPAFRGISTEEFAHISHSVRRNLTVMKDEIGIDYITGTLLRAAEILNDESIPEQAMRLVARGLFADGVTNDREKEFFMKISDKLRVRREVSQDTIRKIEIAP